MFTKASLKDPSFWALLLLPVLLLAFVLGYLPTTTSTGLFRWQILDIVVVIIAIFTLVSFRPISQYFSSWYRPILLFLAFGWGILFIFSHLTSWQLAYSFLYGLRWGVYSLLIFYSIIFCRQFRRYLAPSLWLAIVFIALLGLVQYVFLPDIRPLAKFAWDPHYFRVVSTLLDPGFTGLILTLGLILGFYLTKISQNQLPKPFTKKRIYIGLLVIFIALMLTYSRSSYLAYLTALTLISFQIKSWRIFVVGLGMFFLTLLIIPHHLPSEGVKLARQNSIIARLISWNTGLQTFQDHPVMGIGFNSYRFYPKSHQPIVISDTYASHAGNAPDSSLLLVLATTGVLGFSLYMYLHYSHLNHTAYDRLTRLLITTTWATISIHSFFLNSWFYSHTLIVWYLILGYALTWKTSPSK